MLVYCDSDCPYCDESIEERVEVFFSMSMTFWRNRACIMRMVLFLRRAGGYEFPTRWLYWWPLVWQEILGRKREAVYLFDYRARCRLPATGTNDRAGRKFSDHCSPLNRVFRGGRAISSQLVARTPGLVAELCHWKSWLPHSSQRNYLYSFSSRSVA